MGKICLCIPAFYIWQGGWSNKGRIKLLRRKRIKRSNPEDDPGDDVHSPPDQDTFEPPEILQEPHLDDQLQDEAAAAPPTPAPRRGIRIRRPANWIASGDYSMQHNASVNPSWLDEKMMVFHAITEKAKQDGMQHVVYKAFMESLMNRWY